jgi:hypothetical protein
MPIGLFARLDMLRIKGSPAAALILEHVAGHNRLRRAGSIKYECQKGGISCYLHRDEMRMGGPPLCDRDRSIN